LPRQTTLLAPRRSARKPIDGFWGMFTPRLSRGLYRLGENQAFQISPEGAT
jgi:hypothetical protein